LFRTGPRGFPRDAARALHARTHRCDGGASARAHSLDTYKGRGEPPLPRVPTCFRPQAAVITAQSRVVDQPGRRAAAAAAAPEFVVPLAEAGRPLLRSQRASIRARVPFSSRKRRGTPAATPRGRGRSGVPLFLPSVLAREETCRLRRARRRSRASISGADLLIGCALFRAVFHLIARGSTMPPRFEESPRNENYSFSLVRMRARARARARIRSLILHKVAPSDSPWLAWLHG